MPKGGILTVRTANCYLDKPFSGYIQEKREIMLFSASPILVKACLPLIYSAYLISSAQRGNGVQ
jgi:hypothetical protein